MSGGANREPALSEARGKTAPRLPSDLGRRLAIAVPAAIVAVGLLALGGLPWALAVAALATGAAAELHRIAEVPVRVRVAGLAVVALLPLAALVGGASASLAVLLALLPASLAAHRGAPQRRAALATLGIVVLGAVWVGLAGAHAVLLRELPEGGLLLVAVLLATFIGDTGAHLVGAAFGRRPLAPRISPAKTLEGLLAGIAVGTFSGYGLLVVASAPIDGLAALAVALAAALAAPVGDLFESFIKRAFEVKDSGRLLGPHGGLLDRLDAALFAVVAGYHMVLLVT